MADRFAESREIGNRLAAKVVEYDRNWWQPWRLPALKREIRYLRVLLLASIEDDSPSCRSST